MCVQKYTKGVLTSGIVVKFDLYSLDSRLVQNLHMSHWVWPIFCRMKYHWKIANIDFLEQDIEIGHYINQTDKLCKHRDCRPVDLE